jgi:hypothetical protein
MHPGLYRCLIGASVPRLPTAADGSSSVGHSLVGSVADGSRHAVTYAVLRRVGGHGGLDRRFTPRL